MNSFTYYILLIPEIYFLFAILFYIFYTSIINLSSHYKFFNFFNNNLYFFCLILINVFILTCNFINVTDINISNFYYKDTFISILQLFTLSFSIILLLVGRSYIKNTGINNFELLILLLFSIFSIFLIPTSNNIPILYLYLELQGISFYILTASTRKNQYSLESGLKYFILGSFSSILLLIGTNIVYAYSALLNFTDLLLFIKDLDLFVTDYSLLGVGFIFIIISFLFKFYAAPFHLWVSDIYQGAPTIITAFFSVIPLPSLFYIFSKIVSLTFLKMYMIYNPIFNITIVLSLFIGTLGALYQRKIKKLLAYSSVTSIGYFLSAFIVQSPIMLYNVYIYIFLYSFSLLSIFAVFLQLRITNRREQKYIEQLSLLNGFIYINKYFTYSLLVFFFNIAGIPPFSLFIGKLFLLTSLAFNHNYIMIFIIVLVTILSCFYYVKLIKIMFFNNPQKLMNLSRPDFISSFIISFFVILNFIFFLNPSIIITLAKFVIFSI